jgi:hypothetical protein
MSCCFRIVLTTQPRWLENAVSGSSISSMILTHAARALLNLVHKKLGY